MSAIASGENKAWDILSRLDINDVCRRSGAVFDQTAGHYILRSFTWDFSVNPSKREIIDIGGSGGILLDRLSYFFRLSVLWHLVKAVDMLPTGKLVKPSNLVGGDIFFRGSHVLPLDGLAGKFSRDKQGFIAKGLTVGGTELRYGDAALELRPLPKIPVTVILWVADEEFPARTDLLFDSSISVHLPLDIIWSVAMMSVLILY